MFCFSPDDRDWGAKVEAATKKAIAELRSATPMGRL
jgi:hypothetical protein